MNLKKVKFLFTLVILSLSLPLFALDSDKQEVMHVVADTASLNQSKHLGTYNGNVEFIQGTSNLHAARAVTKGNNKNQLDLAIAHGDKQKQAHYWTETGPGKPPFHAYANTIRYLPLKHRIELIGNARVVQGTNSLSAAKIIYDTISKHVTSENDASTRTTIIYYPDKKPS